MNILRILKQAVYFVTFLGFLFILLALNSYFIFGLIGSNGYACIPGANINLLNISFGLFLSFSTALLLTTILYISVNPKACAIKSRQKLSFLSSLSAGGGLFTVFCPVCSLPIISVLGLSSSFSLFNTYNIWFKLVSVGLSLMSLWLANNYLSDNPQKPFYKLTHLLK